jgi:hypothetical protein
MIVLQDDDLLVRIDPAHGGEVLDLVDCATSRQLLAPTNWSTTPPRGGALDEDEWIAGYRGGWQTLLPNAGNACEVDGIPHGFHGDASADPWTVVERSPTSATIAWEGHGVRASRTLALVDGALRIDTTLECSGDAPAPLVMVEHLAVGAELLDPEVEVSLPAAPAYQLDVDGRAPAAADDAPLWPELLLLDGSRERADRLTLSEPRERMAALRDLPHGWAALRNVATGQGLAMAWDVDWFPHMWMWHEARTIDAPPWRGMGELLIVEPATSPQHAGLAAAIEDGDAHWVKPGESMGGWLIVRPFRSDQPVGDVAPDGRVRR